MRWDSSISGAARTRFRVLRNGEDIATRPVWNGVGVKVGFSTKANSAVIRDNLVASINDPLALIKAVGVPYDWYSTVKNQG